MAQESNTFREVITNLDKFKVIPDLMLNGGIAYAGFRALNHPLGAVYALLGLKLATNEAPSATIPNVSRVAGIAILAHVGLSQFQAPSIPVDPSPGGCPEGQVRNIHGNCVSMPYVPPIGGGR